MISWNLPYGWRAGTRYIESDASGADVLRYEQEDLGNDLDIPEWVIQELERVPASRVVWVCRTKEHAMRYGDDPYQEDFDPKRAVILVGCQNHGSLIFEDKMWLCPTTLERFALYRAAQTEKILNEKGITMDTLYTYRTAEDFDTIYDLGQEKAQADFRASVLSTPIIYPNLDTAALHIAQQYRESRQASIPNFTGDDALFDWAFASGYIVCFMAEQDAYLGDPEGYLAGICQSDPKLLPAARIVEAESPQERRLKPEQEASGLGE